MTTQSSESPDVAAEPVARPDYPRVEVTPYQPDGGFEASGALMLVSALVLVGAGLGWAAHWVSQFFYLIILFPAAIGFALGAVGVRMVRAGRIRNPWVGGLAGLAGGAFAMTAMHYLDYGTFRQGVADAPPEFREVAALPPAEREALLVDVPAEERDGLRAGLDAVAASGSFPKYMDFVARQGVEISSSRSSSTPLNLGYYGSWIYWMVELLIVAGITYAMVHEATTEPYCAPCGKWKNGQVLGSLATTDAVAAADAVRSGDLAALAAAGATPSPGPLTVSVTTCPECGESGRVDLKLQAITQNKKGETQTNTLAHACYPGAALPALLALFHRNVEPLTPDPQPAEAAAAAATAASA